MQNFKKGRHLYSAYSLQKRLLLFSSSIILLISSSLISVAQTKPLINSTLNGIVSDATTGETLIGASIQIQGTTHTASTDNKGKFNFVTGQKFPYTLIVSYVGYKTAILVVDGSPVNVRLEPEASQLNDVIVVGYGQQNRKTLTSSVATVSAKQIEDIPAAGLDQKLQGQASGLLVSANTSVPGSGIFIRVRGSSSINASNDPLYVVDGVFINNRTLQSITTGGQQTSPIADINPGDIESMEILKDANATAIYGSRGANGVVLITTKRGKLNKKAKVDFGYYHGVSKAIKFWPTLTGEQEGILQNETWLNDGGAFNLRPFRPKSEGGLGLPEEQVTIDRVGLIFQNAPTDNFDLSVAGGDAKTSYYLGGNYFNQEAIVKPDRFRRASFRINLGHQFDEKIKIGVSANLVSTFRNMTPNNNVPNGTVNGALYTPVYLPLYNEDGSYARPSLFENPVAAIKETIFKDVGSRVTANAFGEYKITSGLKFRTSWSIDFNESKAVNFYNSKLQLGQAPVNGTGTTALNRNVTLINEQLLTYDKVWDNIHQFNATVGNTLQKETFENTSVTGVGYPTDEFSQISSSASQTGTSSESQAGLVSFFGRLSYGYNGKYMIDASVRADASSRFGKDNRWGYFPAVGIAWRASQEEFIKKLNLFSELKFNASYGSTGNQNGIPDFAALGLWNGGNNYLNTAGILPFQLANPNLKWETTTQLNLGVNMGFFADRFNVELNYYDKYTSNLLLQQPISQKLGFATIFSNSGEISNKGFELALNGQLIAQKSFSWNARINISTNKNKIEKLNTPILDNRTIMQQGSPLYSFYAHKQLGVNPENGDVLFEDLNGDKALSDADLQIIGDAWPDFYGGLGNEFTYGDFDLNVFFNYSLGNSIWNNTRYRMGHGGSRNGVFAQLQDQLDRWQKPGDITEVPRLTTKGNNASIIPDRFLEDGSYVRLKTVSIGYRLPKKILAKHHISNVRIYLSATNLLTFTKYKGVDPEVNTMGSNQNVMGYDQAIASQPRTFQAGFNVAF
ncbi:MAG: TonB-dependent receptor [Pedobacter sp.]|uniref:SusC/RagA family TonB-linked outer membrane protein n=1 Tax=Pedobacter sp. TaxID=1411316 RepID=UPI003565B1B0